MKVNFINLTEDSIKDYLKIIKKIFRKEKDKLTFNIIFVTEEEIKRLNFEYRQINEVTDVLSFALNDNEDLTNMANNELGDIFICLNRAYSQANEYGHSKKREISFLAVHGYLHLRGYDHLTKEDEVIMIEKQEKMLLKAKLRRS